MAKKDLAKINLSTLPNGYALTVDGKEYMYFNEIDLLAGFMGHVGMREVDYADRGTILSSLMSAMLGDTFTDAVATLKQRVSLLSGKYETTIAKMDDAIAYVNSAQNQIERLEKDINGLQDGFKAALNDNNKLKSETSSAFTMINEIQKKCDKAQNELSNIATFIKSKGEADEGQDVPGKSGDADGQTAESADDGKSKGKKVSRKDKNAKIIEAIEKKANKNQNIK
jgi:outer membrane murein-binding lipoprotein Lpp